MKSKRMYLSGGEENTMTRRKKEKISLYRKRKRKISVNEQAMAAKIKHLYRKTNQSYSSNVTAGLQRNDGNLKIPNRKERSMKEEKILEI